MAVTKTHEILLTPPLALAGQSPMPALRVGIDIAQISAIGASIDAFGERFTHRFFTEAEIAYARQSPHLVNQRFAARFAAKEATIKAFGLAEEGIDWREIEVKRLPTGGCALEVHGRVADLVARSGCGQTALSLSHDGDYATAMLVALAAR